MDECSTHFTDWEDAYDETELPIKAHKGLSYSHRTLLFWGRRSICLNFSIPLLTHRERFALESTLPQKESIKEAIGGELIQRPIPTARVVGRQ